MALVVKQVFIHGIDLSQSADETAEIILVPQNHSARRTRRSYKGKPVRVLFWLLSGLFLQNSRDIADAGKNVYGHREDDSGVFFHANFGQRLQIAQLHGDRDRKSTRLTSSHIPLSRMPSSAK